MKYRESEEMYLETILLLQKRNQEIRSIDIANELNFSRASVSRAVNLLKEKGYITIDKSIIKINPNDINEIVDVSEFLNDYYKQTNKHINFFHTSCPLRNFSTL